MKANELRIGNLIYMSTEDSKYVQPNLIGDVKWKHLRNIEEQGIDQCGYRQIELTEEWLIKFGFEKYDDGGELKGNDCFYGIKNTGIVIGLKPRFNLSGYRPSKRIEYVHQLQNIYFSLTGEELTINEKSY